MKENAEGFLSPVVDESLCSSCGLCVKRCPVLSRINGGEEKSQNGKTAFIFQDKDGGSLSLSTSGGAFACLARWVLSNGGVVFGAAYDDKLNVNHIAVESISELKKIQGSKYVASHLGDSYAQVKALLQNGRLVLFSGTACQIAGLMSYLGKDSDLLIMVDIVCHGIPSQKLFKKYIEWLGEKNGGPIEWFEFRAKRVVGWNLKGAFGVNGKTKLLNPYCDPYYAAFLRGDTYRESCYTCKFANLDRPGDFTLGDFWGFYNCKEKLNFDYKKGLSLLLANTRKAEKICGEIKEFANMVAVDVDVACAGNGNLYHPTKYSDIRQQIYSRIDEPFESLQKKYLYHEGKVGFYIRRLRRKLLSQKTRDALKKLLGK